MTSLHRTNSLTGVSFPVRPKPNPKLNLRFSVNNSNGGSSNEDVQMHTKAQSLVAQKQKQKLKQTQKQKKQSQGQKQKSASVTPNKNHNNYQHTHTSASRQDSWGKVRVSTGIESGRSVGAGTSMGSRLSERERNTRIKPWEWKWKDAGSSANTSDSVSVRRVNGGTNLNVKKTQQNLSHPDGAPLKYNLTTQGRQHSSNPYSRNTGSSSGVNFSTMSASPQPRPQTSLMQQSQSQLHPSLPHPTTARETNSIYTNHCRSTNHQKPASTLPDATPHSNHNQVHGGSSSRSTSNNRNNMNTSRNRYLGGGKAGGLVGARQGLHMNLNNTNNVYPNSTQTSRYNQMLAVQLCGKQLAAAASKRHRLVHRTSLTNSNSRSTNSNSRPISSQTRVNWNGNLAHTNYNTNTNTQSKEETNKRPSVNGSKFLVKAANEPSPAPCFPMSNRNLNPRAQGLPKRQEHRLAAEAKYNTHTNGRAYEGSWTYSATRGSTATGVTGRKKINSNIKTQAQTSVLDQRTSRATNRSSIQNNQQFGTATSTLNPKQLQKLNPSPPPMYPILPSPRRTPKEQQPKLEAAGYQITSFFENPQNNVDDVSTQNTCKDSETNAGRGAGEADEGLAAHALASLALVEGSDSDTPREMDAEAEGRGSGIVERKNGKGKRGQNLSSSSFFVAVDAVVCAAVRIDVLRCDFVSFCLCVSCS